MTTYGSDRNVVNQRGVEFGSCDSLEKTELYSIKLSTIHFAGAHLLLSMSIFALFVYMAVQYLDEENCFAFFIMVYTRCAFWIITCILDVIITRRHNALRRHGYHEFYRSQIAVYRDVPLIIVTLWNMVLFFMVTILLQTNGTEFLMHCITPVQSPGSYVCIFSGLETMLLICVHGVYIMKVSHFNNMHSLPDALRDVEQPFIGYLGVSVDNSKVADLLEKQADLIYYLKQQNTNLQQKLMKLNQKHTNHSIGSYDKI